MLRLLARGLSNKEIAERLVISPKTAGNHIEHIYAKIDASSRAAASLFAMQHGLLPEEGFAAGAAARRVSSCIACMLRVHRLRDLPKLRARAELDELAATGWSSRSCAAR